MRVLKLGQPVVSCASAAAKRCLNGHTAVINPETTVASHGKTAMRHFGRYVLMHGAL